MGEKGNVGEHLAEAVSHHAESGAEVMTGLAAKTGGEFAAGAVLGAATEKLEDRSKRRATRKQPPADDAGTPGTPGTD